MRRLIPQEASHNLLHPVNNLGRKHSALHVVNRQGRKDMLKVTRPAKLIKSACQPANLLLNLSKRSSQSTFFSLWVIRGMPKYLPKDVVAGI